MHSILSLLAINKISASTLQNCFCKAGLDNLCEEAAPTECDGDTDVEQEVQEQLHFIRNTILCQLLKYYLTGI